MIVAGYKSLQVAILCPDNIFVAFCFATIFDFAHVRSGTVNFPGSVSQFIAQVAWFMEAIPHVTRSLQDWFMEPLPKNNWSRGLRKTSLALYALRYFR